MAHSAVSTLVGFSGFLFSSLHSSYERDWFLFLPPCIPGVRSSQDCDPATVHCYHVFLSVACNWTAVLNELFCLAERNATYAGPLRFERNKTLTRKRSKRIGCVAPGRFSRRGTGFIFYFFSRGIYSAWSFKRTCYAEVISEEKKVHAFFLMF